MGIEICLEEESDESLMQMLVGARSHAAFAELVRRHATRFRQIAFRYTGVREEAEDIVQNAFLKIWARPQVWSAERHIVFSSWFYRIVVNACLDYQRRHKPVPMLESEEFADTTELPDAAMETRQQQQRIEQAFRGLPLDMQASLNLSFYEPIPNREAAEIMGLSVKAFQSLLMRAKKTLKERILLQGDKKVRQYGSH